MKPEQLKILYESLNKIRVQGFGLSNVNERLKLHFGEQYGLDVESIENIYTIIRITIPIVQNPEKYLNM
jgi:two-component system, sensor histidine kinase YesM